MLLESQNVACLLLFNIEGGGGMLNSKMIEKYGRLIYWFEIDEQAMEEVG